MQNKGRVLNAAEKKSKATLKGTPVRITADFKKETLKARRA